MGLIRFLLAFSVVICHVGFGDTPMLVIPAFGLSFRILPADLAVQCFFVISGFYMSLILGKTYSLDRTGLKRFYVNRFLRLAPTYWVILGLFFVFAAITGRFYRFEAAQLQSVLSQLPLSTSLWLGFVNLTMFAQDTLLYMGLTPAGHFQWTGDMNAGPIPLQFFIMNPPSWSLSLELWFYMLAPWFAGRSWKILAAVCLASFALRLGLMANGFSEGAWKDRFFPTELLFFVGGMLLERIHQNYRSFFTPRKCATAFGSIFVLGAIYQFIPLDPTVMHWGYLGLFAISVPFVFELTKASRWDRALGELSFPLYLGHLLVQLVVFKTMSGTAEDMSWIVPLLSVAFAIALRVVVESPVERVRSKWRKRAAVVSNPVPLAA